VQELVIPCDIHGVGGIPFSSQGLVCVYRYACCLAVHMRCSKYAVSPYNPSPPVVFGFSFDLMKVRNLQTKDHFIATSSLETTT